MNSSFCSAVQRRIVLEANAVETHQIGSPFGCFHGSSNNCEETLHLDKIWESSCRSCNLCGDLMLIGPSITKSLTTHCKLIMLLVECKVCTQLARTAEMM